MTYHGTVKDGRIELDSQANLPEGARVQVELETKQAAGESWTDLARRYAGCAGDDLPADLAEQHDHYIHGTPKR